MNEDQPSDRESVDEGLRTIAIRERVALLKFLAARRVPASDAEDLIQDLFLKLSSGRTGPVASPRAYLFRMLDNLLLDKRRGDRRRVAREEAWTTHSFPLGKEDERPSVEAVVAGQDDIKVVAEALSALPERTRLMFYRARVEGFSRKAIAAEFGVSVSAVEKHLQRAYEVIVAVRVQLAEEIEAPRRL